LTALPAVNRNAAMFLFDFFLSEDKRIERQIRTLTDRDSQPEDREAAAKWLAENKSRTAIVGLLQRFELNLEHQMKDTTEKEAVYARLVNLGADLVVEPTRAWLAQGRQFALPLRLLAELAGEQAAVQAVFQLLAQEHAKDDFKPDKKKGLLVWLAERKGQPEAVDAAAVFLKDFDEGVRYAAVEVCIAQGTEHAGEVLIPSLGNEKEESGRLKARIAEAFAQKGWRAPESVAAMLHGGYRWKDGRIWGP
jgi:hypothetical protein